MNEFNLDNMFEGLDTTTLRTIDGLSRYKFDLHNGKILDCRRDIWLNPKPNKRGYCYVNLQKDEPTKRKVASVHSLILTAALQYDYRKLFKGLNMICDHRDQCRNNNSIFNLRPRTQSKNLEGRECKPIRLNGEQMEALYKDFYLIDEAKHGEKHNVYLMLSQKYNGYSSHSIQVRYLEYKKQQIA